MHYRSDNRAPNQMRPVSIIPNYINTAEGSVLIELGNTRVICTASVEETVPAFLRNTGKGWISSGYAMLPRSTLTRTPREVTKGRPSGRTHEIQLDRSYEEDSRADVDMNFVMTAGYKLVEVQATAERQVFDEQQLGKMIALARAGVQQLIAKQQAILGVLTLRQ